MTVVIPPPSEDPTAAFLTAIVVAVGRSLSIEFPQRVHDLIEADEWSPRSAMTERRRGLHRARVGSPRRQDGSLFVESEIRIADDLGRMREGLGRMEKFIEIEVP